MKIVDKRKDNHYLKFPDLEIGEVFQIYGKPDFFIKIGDASDTYSYLSLNHHWRAKYIENPVAPTKIIRIPAEQITITVE